ncbi:MAG: GntR family transcriptional regulator [Thermomicrobiales bacterium]
MVIERRRGVTLYAEVRERIEALIASAVLCPGDALPPEGKLQVRFGVSRATVRQALAELERDGIVERRQGRGTFLTLPPMERALPELTGFSEHVRARGMRPSGRLLAFDLLTANGAGDARHFPSGASLVRVVRLRCANDFPVGLHTTHIPAAIAAAAGFDEAGLRANPGLSFYALLERAGITLAWAEEHLRARVATAEEGRLLGAAAGVAIMSVLRLSRDGADRLIEAVRADYLGDKYDYVVQLERRAGRGAAVGPAGGRAGDREDGRW